MGDPNFDHTVVFMIEHDEEGAFGVVINRSYGKLPLAEKVTFTGDGRRLVSATLEPKRGRQQVDLPGPATFRELKMTVDSTAREGAMLPFTNWPHGRPQVAPTECRQTGRLTPPARLWRIRTP